MLEDSLSKIPLRSCAGVSMDDLVYICTKLARQMDAQGLDKIFDTAEAAMGAIEEARPLLQRAVELVNEVSSLINGNPERHFEQQLAGC